MSDQAREHWEAASGQWIDWVRAPDQDPYGVEVNLPELLTLVPPPAV